MMARVPGEAGKFVSQEAGRKEKKLWSVTLFGASAYFCLIGFSIFHKNLLWVSLFKRASLFFFLVAVIASLCGQVAAQTFTILHTFTATDKFPATNTDGARPIGALALDGNTLYGTAIGGGVFGNGIVFKINIDGSGFTTLHSFNEGSWILGGYTNSDGANPLCKLVASDGMLYGTTRNGGGSGFGTVFGLSTGGAGFTVLHTFVGGDGEGTHPISGVILSGDTLYGTTSDVFNFDPSGTIFSVGTNGTGFRTLKSFHMSGAASPLTNSDGANLYAGLVASGNTLYGVTSQGGIWGYGTMFKINSDGSEFTTLHQFTGTNNELSTFGSLTISDNMVYGEDGLRAFSSNADGTGFKILHNFDSIRQDIIYGGYLLLSKDIFYGTSKPGTEHSGSIFSLRTDGARFTDLYNFSASPGIFPMVTNQDGAYPSGLVLSGNSLYGVTEVGGSYGNGTVFRFHFHPSLWSSLLNKPDFDVANRFCWLRLQWIHFAVHQEPCLTRLDHQSSGSHYRQRAEHGYQSHFGHTAIFPVEPAIIDPERSYLSFVASFFDPSALIPCRVGGRDKQN